MWASLVALVVKNLPASGGDVGSIPEPGRSPGGVHAHLSILAWRTPWTEVSGWLWSVESHRVGRD